MIGGAKYAHTNLIARNWRSLSRFYQDLFGCIPVPPQRDYAGPDLSAGTGISGAALRGEHLLLPGSGKDGPTLEIFEYSAVEEPAADSVNSPGFRHIAFAVADVAAARDEVVAAGGSLVGDVVTSVTAKGDRVTWCYVRDPESNIIELQSWSPAS